MAQDVPLAVDQPDPGETLDLVLKAKEGDRAALEAAFERFRPHLERWVALRLGPALRRRLDVEDVIQETLMSAYKAFPAFTPSTSTALRNWILSIAENRIKDANRWYGAGKRDAARDRELHSRLDASITSPSMRAVRREEHERILETLMQLPDHYREVLRVVQFEDRSYEDAGEILGITAKNVSVRLVRARRAFLEAYRDESRTSRWA